MPFLSRRSVDPQLTPRPSLRDKGYPSHLSQTPRSRARSEASLLRRVSTLFTVRRRNPSKTSSFLKPNGGSPGIEHRCPHPWITIPRVSSDTTPASSLEIRRPSGLGRRASLLESSSDSTDSLERGTTDAPDAAPTGFVSLPNLLGGAVCSPERVTFMAKMTNPPVTRPCPPSSIFALPDPVFRAVFEFLARSDLAALARVSRRFCAVARYALYHALDVQTIAAPSVEKLYHLLAAREDLAALVASFYCHTWPSREGVPPPDDGGSVTIPRVPLGTVRQVLQNMRYLKSLTLASFASILSHTPSLTFSLTRLTILDRKITQSQLVAMRSWLAMQPSLESLSFPHLVECASAARASVDEWGVLISSPETDGYGLFDAILPGLKSLRGSTEIVSTLRSAMHAPMEHLTLDVHETLYTGLRPSTVIRSLGGVRDMHIVFGPEVDKRTVEKFLGVTGTMLTGENKPEAMKSLEVEVSWTDDDAAETLYGIVTAIISRFRGLETLKLTSPFRSIQAPMPVAANGPSLLCLSTPAPSAARRASWCTFPSESTSTPDGVGVARREFVACGFEKNYAKTWTKHCPSLSDIQFDFSCSTTDAEVELCGVWFRRKIPQSLLSAAA